RWAELWAGYNTFYGRSDSTALPLRVVDSTWQRFFDQAEPVHALVAEENGQLVGLAHYLFHRSTLQIQSTCYMQDLYTAEQSRGRGVGRKLIDAVYGQARAAGSPGFYWQTHETNRNAMQLYDQVAEHSGFIVYRKRL
ncbi:MAG: GNAT family N-acetyltransferase, partial [Rhodanobacter sp.]